MMDVRDHLSWGRPYLGHTSAGRSSAPRRRPALQGWPSLGPATICLEYPLKCQEVFFHNIQEDTCFFYKINLHSWIVPGHIVEPKIVGKNENNMGLPVVFGEITVIRGVRTTYLWYLVLLWCWEKPQWQSATRRGTSIAAQGSSSWEEKDFSFKMWWHGFPT